MVELVINKKRKEVLEKQLEDIGVPFKFFEVQQEDGPSQTQWIRLDANKQSKDLRNILCNLDLKPAFEGIVTERTLTYKKCEKVMEGNEKFMLLEPTILNDIIILSVINISKFTFPSHLQVFCIWGFGELVTALEAEPGQECYKPPDLFREQARKWAMFFRVVHFDEVQHYLLFWKPLNFNMVHLSQHYEN